MDKLDWTGMFDDIDPEDIIDEPDERELTEEYFWSDGFDYKRSYIREIMRAYPELSDRHLIDAASEQMYESHSESVELSVDDALRFARTDKPVPVEDLVKMLHDAGVTDDNVMEVITNALLTDKPGRVGLVKDQKKTLRAIQLTKLAELVAKNKDVVLLGVPTYDREADWVQAKLAFFNDELNEAEEGALRIMMRTADDYRWSVENGVAVVVFRLRNVWEKYV